MLRNPRSKCAGRRRRRHPTLNTSSSASASTSTSTEAKEGDSDRDTGNDWASSSSGTGAPLRGSPAACGSVRGEGLGSRGRSRPLPTQNGIRDGAQAAEPVFVGINLIGVLEHVQSAFLSIGRE